MNKISIILIFCITVVLVGFFLAYENNWVLNKITGQVGLGGYCSSTSDCSEGVCFGSKCCLLDEMGIPTTCSPTEPTTKKANGGSCSSNVECSSNNCECVGPICTGKYICCPVGAYCCAVDSDCPVGMTCKNQDCFKKDGLPCESGYKCASGNCVHSICCAAGKHCCDSNDDCEDVGSGYQCSANYYCAKETPSPEQPISKKADGQYCYSDSECESGNCNWLGGELSGIMTGVCCSYGKKCCPYSNYIGIDIFIDNIAHECTTNYYLIAKGGTKQPCEACSSNSECASGQCIEFNYGSDKKMQCSEPPTAVPVAYMCCYSDNHYIPNYQSGVDCCGSTDCNSGYECTNYKCMLKGTAVPQISTTTPTTQYQKETDYACHFPSCYADLGNGWKCYSHKQEEKGSYCCAGDIQDIPCDQRKKTPEEKFKEKLEELKKKPKQPKHIPSAEMYFAPPVNELTLRRDEKFTFRLDGRNNGTVTLGQIIIGARIEGSAVQGWMETLGPYYEYEINPGQSVYHRKYKMYEEPDFVIKAVSSGTAKLVLYIIYNLKDEKHEITKTIPITVLEENIKSNPEANRLFNKKGMITVKEVKEKTAIKDYDTRETKMYDELVIVKDENFNWWESDRMEWVANANKIAETVDFESSFASIVTPDIIAKTNDIKGIMQTDMNQKYEDYERQVIAKTLKSTIIPPLAFDLTIGAYAGSLKLSAFEQLENNYPKCRFGVVEIKDSTTKKYDILYYPQGKKAYAMILAEGKK